MTPFLCAVTLSVRRLSDSVASSIPMDTIELSCCAKVNFTLEVSARRADGYHNIDSIVQTIDLSDSLVVKRSSRGITVDTDMPGVPSGPENLVYRACAAFFDETGISPGVECHLRKSIPAQAGLGGGSSDAAAAVVALDILYETRLSQEELARIASKAGSDAALFTAGGTLRIRGRGDSLTPLPDAPKLDVVILKPAVGVSTSWAYAELDKMPNRARQCSSDAVERAVLAGDEEGLVRGLSNDFESVVYAAFPEIAAARDLLRGLGARGVLLCGSGSAVFGVFGSRDEASRAAEQARDRLPLAAAYACSSLSRKECLAALAGMV